ncbi:MAG: 2-oxoacid:acceptor oxidoreductase subunit alpha [Chloroflexota bacterium]|nr:2-oxoacid:acceptor oxidoreductase subunit alpha [Chloroflexota bacterium]
MCALNIQPELKTAHEGEPIVNDFALMIATKNGSGSQTSNEVLIRSLFRMGIPVSAKNLFPSNIKGLPTWYTIRASKDGYIARRATTEIGVVMNQDTAAEDIQNLPPGGVCIIPSDWKWGQSRQDITYYEIPVKATVTQSDIPSEFRDRISNMVYVGVCAQMFDIPLSIVEKALLDTFNGKAKPTAMNFGVIQNAYNWAQENLVKADPFRFEPMNQTEGKILITGNEAAALGSLFGGVSVVAWYPITPSTSLVDGILDHKHIRKDAAGKDTVAVVQAEDELAAVGMIIGAGWAGARSLTSTSGPGISLMSEFVGLAYYAEIPCVIWDITRMGPSTGLPTRTSQGDLLSLHFLSHGDTRHIVLLPGSVAECFEFGWRSLDIADQFQTPVFVMSDLDLGMNIWMSDQFAYPDQPLNQGKALRDKDALDAFIADKGEWFRYRDYDQDGIPYRTLPGVDHMRAAYFTRGTGHTDMGTYSERGDDWVKGLQRITDKINSARALLPQPIADIDPAKQIGILSFGSNDDAIEEARDVLTANGIHTNYMRVRSLPLAQSVHDFIQSHQSVYVIENNFDGQLAQIIRMETNKDTTHVHSMALGDTLPMTATWIVSEITKRENN